MILVDTSVWIDHLSRGASGLAGLLDEEQVVIHPFVIGELACGEIRNRSEVLRLLRALPLAHVAADDEALALIDSHRLMGRGLGWTDVHLLASALLGGDLVCSRDKQMAAAASALKVKFDLE
jgi:predicted nucleic acid-binding protein